jgi:hypothetical protein
MEQVTIGWTCSSDEGEKHITGFWWGTILKSEYFQNPEGYERIILKCVFRKRVARSGSWACPVAVLVLPVLNPESKVKVYKLQEPSTTPDTGGGG